MKWVIKDKQTHDQSQPVGLDWFLFGEEDLQFKHDGTLPLNDFKLFFDDYEIIPVDESTAPDGWVSVEERLPEFVLHERTTSEKMIIEFDGFVTVGSLYKEYHGKTNVWFTVDDTFDEQFNLPVTRWQPLPQPPKQ